MNNEENKTNKKVAMLYYFSSICFYIVAILNFARKDDYYIAITYFALGTTFLCLGISYKNKDKKEQ